VQKVGLFGFRQLPELVGETVQIGFCSRHPIERCAEPAQRPEPLCLAALVARRGWTKAGEHGLDAERPESFGQGHGIAPYPADGVDRHQDAQGAA